MRTLPLALTSCRSTDDNLDHLNSFPKRPNSDTEEMFNGKKMPRKDHTLKFYLVDVHKFVISDAF